MIAAVYGLQALIFILKREFMLIGWMLLYILAYVGPLPSLLSTSQYAAHGQPKLTVRPQIPGLLGLSPHLFVLVDGRLQLGKHA